MELRQLVYLDAVVSHGGFTRGAEHVHVSQSAVSVQVRRLEEELGADLLTRGAGAPMPTEAGKVFLHRARRALAELDAARAEVASLAGE